MKCDLCGKDITEEVVVVPRINTNVSMFDEDISVTASIDNLYDREYMHKWCSEFHNKPSYKNWLEVNKHNSLFIENKSLLPAHFMANHQKCRFCNKDATKFSHWEINGRSHISAISKMKWEETVGFSGHLYLPICDMCFVEKYNLLSHETFLGTYHYVGEIIFDNLSQLEDIAKAEDFVMGRKIYD